MLTYLDLLFYSYIEAHTFPPPHPFNFIRLQLISDKIQPSTELLIAVTNEAKQYLEWHNQHFQPAATIQYIGHSEVEGIYWVPGFLHECHFAFHTNLTKKIIYFSLFYQGQERYFLTVLGTLGFPSTTTEPSPLPPNFKS